LIELGKKIEKDKLTLIGKAKDENNLVAFEGKLLLNVKGLFALGHPISITPTLLLTTQLERAVRQVFWDRIANGRKILVGEPDVQLSLTLNLSAKSKMKPRKYKL
jgi:hypothetical protein